MSWFCSERTFRRRNVRNPSIRALTRLLVGCWKFCKSHARDCSFPIVLVNISWKLNEAWKEELHELFKGAFDRFCRRRNSKVRVNAPEWSVVRTWTRQHGGLIRWSFAKWRSSYDSLTACKTVLVFFYSSWFGRWNSWRPFYGCWIVQRDTRNVWQIEIDTTLQQKFEQLFSGSHVFIAGSRDIIDMKKGWKGSVVFCE